jgi:hypothetical protein
MGTSLDFNMVEIKFTKEKGIDGNILYMKY